MRRHMDRKGLFTDTKLLKISDKLVTTDKCDYPFSLFFSLRKFSLTLVI